METFDTRPGLWPPWPRIGRAALRKIRKILHWGRRVEISYDSFLTHLCSAGYAESLRMEADWEASYLLSSCAQPGRPTTTSPTPKKPR